MNALYDIIGIPFGYLMKLINNVFPNYAVSIIVFTIVTKLLLFPINYKTQKSSARMQLLNPKLEKLRKSYANNPQKLQEEQQKLYMEEGINPMASCLPSFLQMFLLFGVLDVVYKPMTHILRISKSVVKTACGIAGAKTTDLRCELKIMSALEKDPSKFRELGNDFIQNIRDFSDRFTVFGANLGKVPTLHPDSWTREAVILAAIPFVAGLAQLVSSVYSQIHMKKTNPAAQAGGGCMTFMMYFMPVLSVWFAFEVPAGVGFYWIWSSLFSFLIIFGLNQYFNHDRMVKIAEVEKEKARIYAEKHPEKKTFMQRMMEQQALLDQQQNGGNGQSKKDRNGVSRSEMNKYNREKLNEARRRMAEKYGDEYGDDDDNNEE